MEVPARALRQIILGLLPLLIIGLGVLVVLAVQLREVSSPLRGATETAEATLVATGLGDEARQWAVEYDVDGQTRSARLTLTEPTEAEVGQSFTVAYDPTRPDVAYTAGDALDVARQQLANGLFVLVVIVVAAVAVTLVRLARRRRLGSRPATTVRVHREKYRRGVTDRSWLVVATAAGRSYVPVYWNETVDRIGEDARPAKAFGDPDGDALVGFEVDGTPVWPSGRRRNDRPRGAERELEPARGPVSLLRQARADVIGVFFAPLLGLLWAYVDGSGGAGFGIATLVAAGFLFWVPSVYGSDPT